MWVRIFHTTTTPIVKNANKDRQQQPKKVQSYTFFLSNLNRLTLLQHVILITTAYTNSNVKSARNIPLHLPTEVAN